MIEIVVLWYWGRAIYDLAVDKGRRGWLWATLFVLVWFTAEFGSMFAVALIFVLNGQAHPPIALVIVAGLLGALLVSFAFSKFLESRTTLVPPPLPPSGFRPPAFAAPKVAAVPRPVVPTPVVPRPSVAVAPRPAAPPPGPIARPVPPSAPFVPPLDPE